MDLAVLTLVGAVALAAGWQAFYLCARAPPRWQAMQPRDVETEPRLHAYDRATDLLGGQST